MLHEGPCLTCTQTGVPVISGSLGNDARRPRFVPRVAGLRVQSALSLPMLITGQVIGAITPLPTPPTRSVKRAYRVGRTVRRARCGGGVQRAAVGRCSGHG